MTRVLRAAAALVVLMTVVVIASCGTSKADGTVVHVDSTEAVRLINAGEHPVIDLRRPADFAAGHVVGAVNIDASGPGFERRVRGLDERVTYLVYAGTPDQSAPAADEMVRLGIDRVLDAGGFGMLALAGADVEGNGG